MTKIAKYMIGFAFITVTYQNCGSFEADGGGNFSSSSLNGDIIAIPNTKTASVVRASRTLDTLVSCLGTVEPSQASINQMNRSVGTISEEGLANSMTQPMAKSLVGVSAEVCNDLINKERGKPDEERMVFKGVNFSAGGVSIEDSAKRLSRSCWGRNASSAELTEIVSDIETQFADNTDNGTTTTQKMLYLCTAMAASFSTYEM